MKERKTRRLSKLKIRGKAWQKKKSHLSHASNALLRIHQELFTNFDTAKVCYSKHTIHRERI